MRPVPEYQIGDETIVMPITLGPEESTLIFFQNKSPSAPLTPTVESFTGSVTGLSTRPGAYEDYSLVALVKKGRGNSILSNGKSLQLNGSAPPDSQLEYWDLVVEDWHQGENETNVETAVPVHN